MRVGIVGLGLIGGTIAKALNKNHILSAYDISIDALDYAIENNIIHHRYSNIEDLLTHNDVVYLCLYPNDIIRFFKTYSNIIPKELILIEISGIKQKLIEETLKLKIQLANIIFTHPIAGSERIGVTHSDANIFKNANYVITPIKNNEKSSIDVAYNLAKEMGFKQISLTTPKEHDEMISYTSQLTHVMSLSLVNSVSSSLDTKKFIGDSYRDLTRISKINEALWPDLFILNKDALLNKIESFESELRIFKDAIKMNDKRKLKELMVKSTKLRKMMDEGDFNDS